MRPVVLLELDERRTGRSDAREIALEVLHVRDVRAAERVDRLVVVADGEHGGVRARTAAAATWYCRRSVSWNSSTSRCEKAAPVVLADAVVAAEQLVAAQQQLGEIDHTFALAHRLVQRVVLDLAPREFVARPRPAFGRRPSSLANGDEACWSCRARKPLVVDVVRLRGRPLDQRELVLRVHDLEQLRQVRVAVMRAQHPVAQAVERADPHAARIASGVIAERRSSISFAALFVNVTARIDSGVAWPVASSHAMRVVSTRVLPLPAPARISADAHAAA